MNKDTALYILGFIVLIVALVAFSAPRPSAGQELNAEMVLDKLPSVVATIVLTPLVLLFAGVGLRAYRVWERGQRKTRRQPQHQAAPKAKGLTVDQLFRAYMIQQMGLRKSSRDDRPRMEL